MCRAVTFTAIAIESSIAACHREMCRRWSSGPYIEVACQKVCFQGEDFIGAIRSSEWAERGFCKKCGPNLFYHLVDSSDHQMSAGLIDDPSSPQMSVKVFADSKPHYYEFANKTEMVTGAEVAAQYAPTSE